jgi:hypothetical protein
VDPGVKLIGQALGGTRNVKVKSPWEKNVVSVERLFADSSPAKHKLTRETIFLARQTHKNPRPPSRCAGILPLKKF